MSRKRNKPSQSRTLSAAEADRLEDVGQDRVAAQESSNLDEAESESRVNLRRRKPGHHHPAEPSYSVGYGRPPTHTQFKPGQSGNPKGRSPQSTNLATIVKQVLGEHTPIRTGGRVRQMSKIEALFRSLLARAFKGDLKALHGLLVVMNKSGYGVEAESSPSLPAGVDYQAIIADFLSRNVVGDPLATTPAEDDTVDPSGRNKSSV